MTPDELAIASRSAEAAWTVHLGREVPRQELLRELEEGTLSAAFAATAEATPDRPALSMGGQHATHGQLDARAARIAGWLQARGIGPGDRVVVSGPSSLEFLVAYVGTLRSGATVVLANPGYSPRELRHIIETSGAVAALAEPDAAGVLDELARELSSLRLVAATGADELDGPAIAPVEVTGDDIALLAYSSGTTGAPKGVPLSHRNLLSSIRGVMAAWRWAPDDVLVHALPLYHQHGLGGAHATLLAGSRAVVLDRFDAAALAATIEAERATVMFAVPTIYERLTSWVGARSSMFSSLRLFTSGSAPLSPTLAERAGELFGQVPLERYGSTEAGLDVSNPYDGERAVGTVGLPLPGIELAIVGPVGRPVGRGDEGEIVLRGPQVFAGYDNAPDISAGAFFPGGWFRTGDLGRVSESGYLTITGRLKELIITGGMNVSPREVELVLEGHAGVGRAVVVGVPSERWGEEVVAFVVPLPGAAIDTDALLQGARQELAAYKCPKRILVRDALPVDHLGKVRRRELSESAAAPS